MSFPLESSHHFQRSELARNIAKWQAHALKLKEGSFKSVYRWAHHCIDTAASTMEVPVGGEYVGDDLEQEGEGGTTAAGIEKWKASEEALGRRAGVACTVLDALMSELCADSDLWAKLRPLLFQHKEGIDVGGVVGMYSLVFDCHEYYVVPSIHFSVSLS
jgi:hypothetical protein